jgi:SAM-dependent methyltransferase
MNPFLFSHHLVPPKLRKRIRRLLATWGWEHLFLRKRRPGLAYLKGDGIEIGAFEHPAPLARGCRTCYVDAITREQAAVLFPEIDVSALVVPDHLIDLNRDGLMRFHDAQWDYAIACHVIEHLENPGRFVGELFRVVRAGGLVVIAAPDKRFTFDRARPETPEAELHRYFAEGRTVTPADYADISRYVNTADMALDDGARVRRLEIYRSRREHLSVWTSEGFRRFWISAMQWNGILAEPIYEVDGEHNRFEYFGVWKYQGTQTASRAIPGQSQAH